MDKAIAEHYELVATRLEALEQTPDAEALHRLYDYHMDRVRDFQHERLIHLLVTFFFGGLLLLAVAGLFMIVVQSPFLGNVATLLTVLVSGVAVLLLIVELFYVRYYYKLENGTQKLYELSVRLYGLLK